MFDKREFKPTIKSEYEIQAKEFLEKNEIIITKQPVRYNYNKEHKLTQLVYYVVIQRHYLDNTKNLKPNPYIIIPEFFDSHINTEKMIYLGNYSILASITKYDPYSHKNFCDEFGIDEDSIKGLEQYRAVKKEWEQVEKFFNLAELEALREIN